MKVRKERLGRILTGARRVLFACSALLLAYCGFAVVDAWMFQRRAGREFDRLRSDRLAASEAAPQMEPVVFPKVAPAAVRSLIGRIEIPRLRVSAVLLDGVDETTLRRAVGHIPGTALPGDAGNVGLAGHRDTFFRRLKDLKVKDEVRVSTLRGIFRYEVVSLRIVDLDNVGVLAPSHENVLTLVTCYPFSFVGPAPKRWIVRARQVSAPAVTPSNVK